MTAFLFVGERPSPAAVRLGVTWEDGRLAAKQLFDALRAIGLDPAGQKYDNVFRPDLRHAESVCPQALCRIRRAARRYRVVAMGRKVEKVLRAWGIGCRTIVHPAARGKIRRKSVYAEHVRGVLLESKAAPGSGLRPEPRARAGPGRPENPPGR